jgi:hypothetical protein
MPERIRTALTTAAAIVSIAVSWVVCAGPASALDTMYTGNGTVKLTDGNSGFTISCTSTVSGAYNTSTPPEIATLTGAAFSSCTGSGLSFTVAAGGLAWTVTTTSSTPNQAGTIGHMSLTVSAAGCSFTVNGTIATGHHGKIRFTYNYTPPVLKFLSTGGNLHLWNVSGCFGLVSGGDAATLSGSYKVT